MKLLGFKSCEKSWIHKKKNNSENINGSFKKVLLKKYIFTFKSKFSIGASSGVGNMKEPLLCILRLYKKLDPDF